MTATAIATAPGHRQTQRGSEDPRRHKCRGREDPQKGHHHGDEHPAGVFGKEGGQERPDSGEDQHARQHHGIGVHRLAEEETEPLQKDDLDHDETETEAGEVGEE